MDVAYKFFHLFLRDGSPIVNSNMPWCSTVILCLSSRCRARAVGWILIARHYASNDAFDRKLMASPGPLRYANEHRQAPHRPRLLATHYQLTFPWCWSTRYTCRTSPNWCLTLCISNDVVLTVKVFLPYVFFVFIFKLTNFDKLNTFKKILKSISFWSWSV